MDDETPFRNVMKNGGPAFPQSVSLPNGGTGVAYGMTLRDWFAGQALVGDLAGYAGRAKVPSEANAAMRAYAIADAMLKARA